MTQTPLDTFRVLCPFVDGIDVHHDFINYKFDRFDRHNLKYGLKVSNEIIERHELPLKASMSGLFKNVLHITENK